MSCWPRTWRATGRPRRPAGRGQRLARAGVEGDRALGNETGGAPISRAPISATGTCGARANRGALLIGADLRRADLRVSDLAGADLRGADIRGADLRGALFVTRSQLEAATGDAATFLSSQLAPAHW